MAIAVVAATATGPTAAHEAPRLVEYFPSVEHVPSSGDAASAPSVVGSATLDAIHDDPSAVDGEAGEFAQQALEPSKLVLAAAIPIMRNAAGDRKLSSTPSADRAG